MRGTPGEALTTKLQGPESGSAVRMRTGSWIATLSFRERTLRRCVVVASLSFVITRDFVGGAVYARVQRCDDDDPRDAMSNVARVTRTLAS